MPGIRLIELDILRDETHDLTRGEVWTRIFSLVQKPRTIFVTTPPCHTFSRARHRRPGPPPLRSVDWPKGFPWLSEKHYQDVESSNYFITQSVQASYLAHSAGNPYLWEHPEDLGKAADDLIPATIWQWPEILDLLSATSAQCFAFYQCQFEAPYPKPTRVLTTLPFFQHRQPPYSGLPSFSKVGAYLGPLPPQCSHGGNHEPLIGKDENTGAWKTAPAASYPPAMCKWLAEAIAYSFKCLHQSLQAKGTKGSGPGTAATHQGSTLPPFPSSGLVTAPSSGLVTAPTVSTQGSALVPASKVAAQGAVLSTPSAAHPFPPPFPSSGLDSAPRVLATEASPGLTRAASPHSHPSSGLGPTATRVPAVFNQPAHHPRSGLGPTAPRVTTERAQPGQQDTTTGESGAASPHAPETFAEEILKRPECQRSEVERLFDMLPKELPPRQEEGQAEGTSFSTGCYSKGGITGLRHNTMAYPKSTRLLVRFARQVFPSLSFSTLSLFHRCIVIHVMGPTPMGSSQ